jgi:hypothetical protein
MDEFEQWGEVSALKRGVIWKEEFGCLIAGRECMLGSRYCKGVAAGLE